MSSSDSPLSSVELRRRFKRRLSAPSKREHTLSSRAPCHLLPHSLETLDLPSSPTQTLASVRVLVLHHLEDLEQRLRDIDSTGLEAWKVKGNDKMEEVRIWAKTALEMLDSIRADVCSHLPDLPFSDMSLDSISARVREVDIMDVPNLEEMRSHLPDLPSLRARISELSLSDVYSKLDDVRFSLHDFDFAKPLAYIPVLSDHLVNFHSHLTSPHPSSHFDVSTWTPTITLSDLVDSLRSSDLVQSFMSAQEGEVGDKIERAAIDVTDALKRSLRGVRLLTSLEVPEQWKSNPFVVGGYRFIPLERWPLLLLSLFAFHNETLNIHTHLVPAFVGCLNLLPYWNPSFAQDVPELAFISFALLCLFSSAVWHTMSGCSHQASMEFCARIDYVGIGWLISASVGTVVYYGYQCQPDLRNTFLLVCLAMGLAGNICPFMTWFNKYEYRAWRVTFFLALACSAIAPITGLIILHSFAETLAFVSPVFPSIASYLIGLVFYTTHIPERWLPEAWCIKLNAFGGGSHSIWHCFIVLAVMQHKAAIAVLREGMQCVSL